MGSLTVGPDGRLMLDGQPISSPFGSAGNTVFSTQVGNLREDSSQNALPEGMQSAMDQGIIDLGGNLTPQARSELGGKIPIGQSGIGGPGEAIDPSLVTWDPKYGLVTDPTNIKAPAKGFADTLGQAVKIATIAAIAGGAGVMAGGALGAGGAAAGEAGAAAGTPIDAATAFGAGGLAPEEMGIGNYLAGAGAAAPAAAASVGTPIDASTAFGPGGLSPEEMGISNYLAGPGLASTPSWLQQAGSLLRDTLGGSGKTPGALSVMGGGGSSMAPKIGQHNQDSDPYGLAASGAAPWRGLLDNPQQKIADAIMKKTQINPWG